MEKRQGQRSGLPSQVQGLTTEGAHSLNALAMFAFLSLCFLGLLTFHVHGALAYFQELGDLAAYAGARFTYRLFLVLICFSAVVLLVAAVQEVVFTFQVFFAFLSWLQSVIMVLSLLMMFAFIVSVTFTAGEDPGAFEPGTFVFFGVVCLVLSTISVLIHIRFLRLRLHDPAAKSRPRKQRVDLAPLRRFRAVWIAAAIAIVIGNIVTSGHYVLFTVFALVGVVMIAVVPSLPVEVGYSAVLRAKDATFREELDRQALRQNRIRFAKTSVKVLLILVLAVAALVALGLFA